MKLTRRDFTKQAVFMASASLSGPALLKAAAGNKTQQPNILIILTDDSGYTDLGCYGSEIDTPNINKLGYGGMRFSNFYTAARCSPTRASLLTGRDSAYAGFAAGTLGGWNRELKMPPYRARLCDQLPTVAELLKTSGYQTMMAGKWHLGGSLMKDSPARQALWKKLHPGWELTKAEIEADFNALPAQRGFDRFFGLVEGETHHFFTPEDDHEYLEGNERTKLDYDRTYDMYCYYTTKGSYPYTDNHGKKKKAFYATDGTTDRAIDMINEASGSEKPFFMYLAYRAPHLPLQAPADLVEKYLPRYDDLVKVEHERVEGLKREKLLAEDAEYREYFKYRQNMNKEKKKDYQLRLAIHAAMIEKVDDNVKKIVDTLEKNGQLENTLILYFSDNGAAAHVGDMMNKPYRGCKALLWEGGTKTHLIAYWKGHIEAGAINHTVCDVKDILPTCLKLAGAEYPKTFHDKNISLPEGRDISRTFKNQLLEPAEYIFLNDKGQQGCIYKGKWKLLIEPGWYVLTSKKPGVELELYDLETDPAETKNIADQNREIVDQLVKACSRWQEKCGIIDYEKILQIRPDHMK